MMPDVPKPLPSILFARSHARQVAVVAESLAPFGLSLDEGSPTNVRRPALIQSATQGAPVIVMTLHLASEIDQPRHAGPPPAIELLCDALNRSGAADGI